MIETNKRKSIEKDNPGRLRRLRRLGSAVIDRLPTGESEPRRAFKRALKTANRTIPETLEYYDRDGDGARRVRQKEFDPKVTYANTMRAFAQYFPSAQERLVGASSDFISDMAVESSHDTVPLAEIDTLLGAYPENVIEHLGEAASEESFAAVLEAGHELISKYGGEDSYNDASVKGRIASLVGEQIPQLVALRGAEGLEEIRELQTNHIRDVQRYLDFALDSHAGAEVKPFDAESKTGLIPKESPFTREDTEVWRNESWMGREDRPPEWADLAAMMETTGRHGGEYGLVIAKSEDGTPTLGFVRGGNATVSNRNKLEGGDMVFFHSHPSMEMTADGLYGPLVSQGDINGTHAGDYGGGYLNVVCEDGVTFHFDSMMTEEDARVTSYQVESGPAVGERIDSSTTHPDETAEVMAKLREAGEPYVYSVTMPKTGNTPNRLLFAHIPWRNLESQADFYDVCFGDGLPDVLPPQVGDTDGLPPSLWSAVRKTKRGDNNIRAAMVT